MCRGYDVPTFCPHFAHTLRGSSRRLTPVDPRLCWGQEPDRGIEGNHDFFSGSGSSYVIGKAVNTEDEDWDF